MILFKMVGVSTLLAGFALAGAGCYSEHKIEAATTHQIEVKPIHITVDVNIKVDKALDDFFSDIDDAPVTDANS